MLVASVQELAVPKPRYQVCGIQFQVRKMEIRNVLHRAIKID